MPLRPRPCRSGRSPCSLSSWSLVSSRQYRVSYLPRSLSDPISSPKQLRIQHHALDGPDSPRKAGFNGSVRALNRFPPGPGPKLDRTAPLIRHAFVFHNCISLPLSVVNASGCSASLDIKARRVDRVPRYAYAQRVAHRHLRTSELRSTLDLPCDPSLVTARHAVARSSRDSGSHRCGSQGARRHRFRSRYALAPALERAESWLTLLPRRLLPQNRRLAV